MGQKPQTVLAFYLGQTRTRPKGGRVWPAGRRFRNAEPGGPQCGPQAKPWPQRGHHKQNRAAKRPTKPNQAATRPTQAKPGSKAPHKAKPGRNAAHRKQNRAAGGPKPSHGRSAAHRKQNHGRIAPPKPSHGRSAATTSQTGPQSAPQAKPGRKASIKQNRACRLRRPYGRHQPAGAIKNLV